MMINKRNKIMSIKQTKEIREYAGNLQAAIKLNEHCIAQFKSDFEENPFEALSGTAQIMEIVAMTDAQKRIVELIESDTLNSMVEVYGIVRDSAFSPVSNIMAQHSNSAYASQINYLKELC